MQQICGPLVVVLAACEAATAPSVPHAGPVAQRVVDWVGRTYAGTVDGTVDGQPFSSGFEMTFTTQFNEDGDFGGTWTAGASEPGKFEVETARDGRLLLTFYDALTFDTPQRCVFVGTASPERGGRQLSGDYATSEGSLCSEAVSARFTVTWER